MNRAQKLISIGFLLALVFGAVCPPWQQTYKGEPLAYAGELGRHFLWQRPPATGEKSWMVIAPASECEVFIDKVKLEWQLAILVVIGALLLFASRTRPRQAVHNDNGAGPRMSDWKYAGIAALVLICTAAYVVFAIHPGGFEGQIGWFYILLPGAYVYGTIATGVAKIAPALLRDSLITLLIFGASFLWYFAISDAAIAIYRLSMSRFTNHGAAKS
jgi:uncharacterized membrane protein